MGYNSTKGSRNLLSEEVVLSKYALTSKDHVHLTDKLHSGSSLKVILKVRQRAVCFWVHLGVIHGLVDIHTHC